MYWELQRLNLGRDTVQPTTCVLTLSLDQDIQQFRWCLGFHSSVNKSQGKALIISNLGRAQTRAEEWGSDIEKDAKLR